MKNGDFSIAMLNYQRVNQKTCSIEVDFSLKKKVVAMDNQDLR